MNLFFLISIIAGVGAVVIFTASNYLSEPDIGMSGDVPVMQDVSLEL